MSGSAIAKFSKKQQWRTHVFQIKDGALNYFRQEMVQSLLCIEEYMIQIFSVLKLDGQTI